MNYSYFHHLSINKRAKLGEHTFFKTLFVFFSSRTVKMLFVLSDVFWILPTFSPLTPLQSLRVATSSTQGSYVLRSGPGAFRAFRAIRCGLHCPSFLFFASEKIRTVRHTKQIVLYARKSESSWTLEKICLKIRLASCQDMLWKLTFGLKNFLKTLDYLTFWRNKTTVVLD